MEPRWADQQFAGLPLSRREFIRKLAALGIAVPALPLLLEACGSSKKSSSTPTTAASTRATNQELTIGDTQDLYVTSGPKSYLGMYPLNANIYEPLVRLQPDYSIAPALALSWEQMGANTFRFHLRPGVTFHDGSPFTAADVKYTFDRIASGGGGNVGLTTASTVVVDPMTVDVTPKKADLRVVEQIVHPEYSILKQGTQPGPPGPGTGAFKWVDYVRQSRVTVIRHDGYWGTKAQASKITFQFIPDDNSRGLALASGQLDIARDLPRPAVTSLQKQANIQVVKAPVGLYNALYINIHGKAPYTIGADPAVRTAIQTGLDRAGLIKSVFGGLGQPAQTLLPPAILGPAASMVQGFTHDPAKATAALDAAGWTAAGGGIRAKNGTPLSLLLVNGFPDAASNAGVPEFVQANLREIGIDIKIQTEPDTDTYSATLGKGAGDLFLETGNQNDANPAFLPQILFYSRQSFLDYANLFGPGPAFDDLIDTAQAATSEDAVKQAVAAAMHQVVDVSQVLVQTAGLYRIFGLGSKIQGLDPHPSDVNQSWGSIYRTT
ncbi:MAG: ABC transporter substrate-binding protein [Actinomycetota bacterium]|nr:ABC transporter substrate-binding protein [Actinomycetota bacterium]